MKPQTPTQQQMILAHLHHFGSIEPLTALREYGCYRLGAVIFNLRREGYDITTDRVESTSRITGRPVMFARYTLFDKANSIVSTEKIDSIETND